MGIHNNILVILIGPNHLGHIIEHGNVWRGQCLMPSSNKGYLVRGVLRPLEWENLGITMILGVLMMMS